MLMAPVMNILLKTLVVAKPVFFSLSDCLPLHSPRVGRESLSFFKELGSRVCFLALGPRNPALPLTPKTALVLTYE